MQSDVMVHPVGVRTRRRLLRRAALALALWLVAATVLSAGGVLAALVEVAPTVVIPAFVTLGMLVPLLAVARSTQLQAVFLRAPLPYLTVFNVWRVPAALVFFAYGAAGLLPASFVIIAGIGDLIAGVLAIVVVLVAPRLGARAGQRAYLAFHIFSFGDFVTAVGTGITLTLLGDPLMASLADFPLALIPLFGVPVTGVLSLIALWRLGRTGPPRGLRGR